MIRKLTLALFLTLPSMAVAIDLEGYYITAKGGVSKTSNTGTVSSVDDRGDTNNYENEDLGTGTTFGLSVGKYLNDNFRLELEAIKRNGYEFDARNIATTDHREKAKIETHTLFINGFYDFQPFAMSNTSITPYLGGGVGISRNKIGTSFLHVSGVPNGVKSNGNTINEFAYKLSAGTLVSLTEQLSLDVNYQYVNLGAFKQGTERTNDDGSTSIHRRGINGGEIKSQELMVGLQYTF